MISSLEGIRLGRDQEGTSEGTRPEIWCHGTRRFLFLHCVTVYRRGLSVNPEVDNPETLR